MDAALFLAFCASFFLISISPGLCMTLALSLGISIGVRRTLWMMLGELVGITLVGIAALAGAATLIASSPNAFAVAKLLGAAYLLWAALRAWRAPVELNANAPVMIISAKQLISQGFITAVSNPKAWIFFAALLPPFIDANKPLLLQASILLTAMVVIEFISMLIYATGGRALREYLGKRGLGQWLNRIAACLMVGVAVWLILG